MKLPLSVRVYVVAVAAATGLSLAGWIWAWPDGTGIEPYGAAGWLLPITFGLLSAAAAMYPLQVGQDHKLVINDVVNFAALLLFGAPLAILAVGLGSAAGHVVLTFRRRRPIWEVIFNPAKNALCVAAGGAIYYAIMPARAPIAFDDLRNVAMLPATAIVMYLFNTLPTCVVIGLQHAKSPLSIWLNGRRVDILQSVALYLLGLVTALTVQEHPWAVLVMALPTAPIYVTLKRTVQFLDQQLDSRTHTVSAVEAMADTVDARNTFTRDHSRRVAEYAKRIARTLALPDKEIEQIRMAARVLGLGKIGIADEILRKPGRLTADEWEQMEKHVRTAYDVLGGFPEYGECRELVLQHRERWDGSGYPQALQEGEIRLGSQIVGVADALVAMTSERPYRPAMTLAVALAELQRQSGRLWHPAVVDTALALLGSSPVAAPSLQPVPALV